MVDHHEEKISTKPLTPIERRELRIMLRNNERKAWLRRQCGIWLKYVGTVPATAAGIYFIFNWLAPLMQAMPKK